MIFEKIFQKKKPVKKETKIAKKVVKEPVEPKKEALKTMKTAAPRHFNVSRILLAPHITEKATGLSAVNQYIFKVFARANKTEVKKAVEHLYKVKVVSVKIINVSAKKKRIGKAQGWKKGYKKAIIKVKKGQQIEAATV